MRISKLANIDVVILCGGIGKRLRSVLKDKPKVLAEVKGKAFLDILIDNLLHFGFKRIILSVGYKKEIIKEHFSNNKRRYKLLFSEEEVPLGTGGALQKARPLIASETFLAMNGDSFCDVDFNKLSEFHTNKNALITMVLVRTKDMKDYGSVTIDSAQRIVNFGEKTASRGRMMVNAGIYLMQRDVFRHMPRAKIFLLEYDFFPCMVDGRFFGYIVDKEFIDIGTPKRYRRAYRLLEVIA